MALQLTNAAIQNAKAAAKPYKLPKEQGLFLLVNPNGSKLWRLAYTFGGKEKLLSLGRYPEITLKDARERRDDARRLLSRSIDPSMHRQDQKARSDEATANSFEAVAREWIARHLADKATGHREKIVARLERDVFPWIGSRPISGLTAPDVLAVARRIESRGAYETAHRAVQNIGQVFRYAVATGRAQVDPTPSLRGALTPYQSKHMAAPADDPQAVGAILRSLLSFKGSFVVASAIRLLPLVFCRPGELRTMRWSDINLDAAEWRFVTSKTNSDHLVPLSAQAVAVLRDLQPLTGHLPGGWVFPGGRSPMRPLSEMAINAAYRRMGINKTELTGHGWRAVARTMLHERLNFRSEVIEHQLAHQVPDKLGGAYNRTKFIDERRKMMQAWADYLDSLRDDRKTTAIGLRRTARTIHAHQTAQSSPWRS